MAKGAIAQIAARQPQTPAQSAQHRIGLSPARIPDAPPPRYLQDMQRRIDQLEKRSTGLEERIQGVAKAAQ
eukprot:15289796-Alexandrium_andersonii.AAC.1